MTVQELYEQCQLSILSEELLRSSEPFSCGSTEDERDLNEFLNNDALLYQKKLIGKTYVFTRKQSAAEPMHPKQIVTFFTLANDSIRLTNKMTETIRQQFLEDTDLRDKDTKRFPGVLLGRLGTNERFSGQGYGSAVMEFIKTMFITQNKTGCRFIIVDALNNERTIKYYKHNGFQFLIDDETQEAKYVGIGLSHLPLNTRLMYFDLLTLQIE